ncbi:MAG: Holliday junction resolvase RuvX, partial [Coxiellaceae bacterium]|nr:Holliday junction resolvase RuvX [Coxiellaceae bacterium]
AKRFMKELHTHTKLPVYACDERLTTHEAKCLYRDLQQENKRIKLSIDSVAAKIILESWLENTTINATD